MAEIPHPPSVTLTITGSETTGGAGAQADLKTFQELGVYGIAALTCIVSLDPKDNWNHRFVPVDAQVIADQLEPVQSCYRLDTVKIGMPGTPATIAARTAKDFVTAAIRNRVSSQAPFDAVWQGGGTRS